MPRFFKLKKLKLFSENKFGKYALYALGEILLVVVGILIALQINNWNEGKKQERLLAGIFQNVSYDLERDTLLMNVAIAYYDIREKDSNKLLNDEFTREDFNTCATCPSMITSYFPLTINNKGYSQLKDFYDDSKKRDSLTVDVVQFYTAFSAIMDELGGEVKSNTIQNLEHWRDNYPWFSKIVSGKEDDRFQEYMLTDQDFKNRVAYYNTIACKNYLQLLKAYKANAVVLLQKIDERNAEN